VAAHIIEATESIPSKIKLGTVLTNYKGDKFTIKGITFDVSGSDVSPNIEYEWESDGKKGTGTAVWKAFLRRTFSESETFPFDLEGGEGGNVTRAIRPEESDGVVSRYVVLLVGVSRMSNSDMMKRLKPDGWDMSHVPGGRSHSSNKGSFVFATEVRGTLKQARMVARNANQDFRQAFKSFRSVKGGHFLIHDVNADAPVVLPPEDGGRGEGFRGDPDGPSGAAYAFDGVAASNHQLKRWGIRV